MNNKKYFFVGIFILVLSLGFVFAISYDLVSSSQTASAGNTVSLVTFNISNTTGTGENATLDSVTINLIGTASSGNITNVTLSGDGVVYSNSSGDFPVVISIDKNITEEVNFTVNFTLSSSATWNFTFGANVTAVSNSTSNASNTYVVYDALPYASGLVTIDESTAPTATAACSPSTVYITGNFPCTCSGSDSGADASGVSSSSGSSTSPDGITTPLTVGTFTYTCTVTDASGNSASSTATYEVLNVGGSSNSNSDVSPAKVHSFAKITPGVVSIVKDFDSQIGLKEIEISVNNEAQNVKITVIKYDGKPAEVSIEKSGDVYEYLEIDTENLNENLDNAKIISKVRKSWVSGNGLSKEEISLFKFDENNEKWNEIQTVFESEDGTYYYYASEVDSFSYFAISEKTLAEDEGTPADEDTEVVSEKRNSALVWILVILAVLVALRFFMNPKKKK